jgi:hypothetical protein
VLYPRRQEKEKKNPQKNILGAAAFYLPAKFLLALASRVSHGTHNRILMSDVLWSLQTPLNGDY